MRETIEFRIPEDSARGVLSPDDGTTLGGSVRKIELPMTDERRAWWLQRGRCYVGLRTSSAGLRGTCGRSSRESPALASFTLGRRTSCACSLASDDSANPDRAARSTTSCSTSSSLQQLLRRSKSPTRFKRAGRSSLRALRDLHYGTRSRSRTDGSSPRARGGSRSVSTWGRGRHADSWAARTAPPESSASPTGSGLHAE
jgi:hypothetical protein